MLCACYFAFLFACNSLLPAAAQSGAATGVRRAAVYEYETRPDDEEFHFRIHHPRRHPKPGPLLLSRR